MTATVYGLEKLALRARKTALNATGPPPKRRPDGPSDPPRVLLRGWCLAGLGILAAEALDPACRGDQALFAGEVGVARRTDFHVDVALVGRTGFKVVAAGAHHAHRSVIGMDLFLGHLLNLSCSLPHMIVGAIECLGNAGQGSGIRGQGSGIRGQGTWIGDRKRL